MTYQVTVPAGDVNVAMPNLLCYQGGGSGVTFVLSDDEFSELAGASSSPYEIDYSTDYLGSQPLYSFTYLGGDASYTVTLKSGLVNVVLPNGLRYQEGASVTLSDAEYSLIRPSAAAALFASTSVVIT